MHVATSEIKQLAIYLSVRVHSCKALINHQGPVEALGEVGGLEGCLTKQSASGRVEPLWRGGAQDEGMVAHKKNRRAGLSKATEC